MRVGPYYARKTLIYAASGANGGSLWCDSPVESNRRLIITLAGVMLCTLFSSKACPLLVVSQEDGGPKLAIDGVWLREKDRGEL